MACRATDYIFMYMFFHPMQRPTAWRLHATGRYTLRLSRERSGNRPLRGAAEGRRVSTTKQQQYKHVVSFSGCATIVQIQGVSPNAPSVFVRCGCAHLLRSSILLLPASVCLFFPLRPPLYVISLFRVFFIMESFVCQMSYPYSCSIILPASMDGLSDGGHGDQNARTRNLPRAGFVFYPSS